MNKLIKILTCVLALIIVINISNLKASGQSRDKKTSPQTPTNTDKDTKQLSCQDESLLKNIETEGFRLGMSKAEISKIIPKIKWTYNREENTAYSIISDSNNKAYSLFSDSDNKNNSKKFLPANIVDVSLKLFDEKLFFYAIAYDDSKKWSSVQEFIEFFSDKNNLPKNYWRFSSEHIADISCVPYLFEVSVDTGGRASFTLENLSYYSEIRKYKKLLSKQKRKISKPLTKNK